MARIRALFGVLAALQFATVGEAQAISTTSVGSSPTVSSSTSALSPSQSASATSSAPVASGKTPFSEITGPSSLQLGTVIVDAAGGGQFTAINSAISYAQTFAQPTVIVRAGTYNEAVTVCIFSRSSFRHWMSRKVWQLHMTPFQNVSSTLLHGNFLKEQC
jgi:pectin methylesterase-like acyl-CoA thioesterase